MLWETLSLSTPGSPSVMAATVPAMSRISQAEKPLQSNHNKDRQPVRRDPGIAANHRSARAHDQVYLVHLRRPGQPDRRQRQPHRLGSRFAGTLTDRVHDGGTIRRWGVSGASSESKPSRQRKLSRRRTGCLNHKSLYFTQLPTLCGKMRNSQQSHEAMLLARLLARRQKSFQRAHPLFRDKL